MYTYLTLNASQLRSRYGTYFAHVILRTNNGYSRMTFVFMGKVFSVRL